MKSFYFGTLCILISMFSLTSQAQKIKLTEGSLVGLGSEKKINIEYAYDNMKVGKFNTEEEYVTDKKTDLDKKEPGRGETWSKSWISDRKGRFEPKFNELFEKSSEMSVDPASKYTVIFKTTFTEPGYNVGVWRKNAEINGEAWVVETANKEKPVAKISLQKALGRTFGGYDFDTGVRIAEAYADAGKALGKFIKTEGK